jgi:hypothetical protein
MLLTVDKNGPWLTGSISCAALIVPLQGALAPEENIPLAEGLQRWLALEDFYRTQLRLRILMKSGTGRAPDPTTVPWHLETSHTVMWVEPN